MFPNLAQCNIWVYIDIKQSRSKREKNWKNLNKMQGRKKPTNSYFICIEKEGNHRINNARRRKLNLESIFEKDRKKIRELLLDKRGPLNMCKNEEGGGECADDDRHLLFLLFLLF